MCIMKRLCFKCFVSKQSAFTYFKDSEKMRTKYREREDEREKERMRLDIH